MDTDTKKEMDIKNKEFINKSFKILFGTVQKEVHLTAVEKGWWKNERSIGELIALVHSELSEGLEAARHGNPPSEHIPEFSGLEEELADVVIRCMDMCQALQLDLAGAIIAKINFNATKEDMHGGKEF